LPIRCCFDTVFSSGWAALVLLYAIAASAWNIVGGYAGQVSVGHVVFFGCGAYASMAAYFAFRAGPALVEFPLVVASKPADRSHHRRADAALVGPLLQHGDHRGGRTRPADRHQHRLLGAAWPQRRPCREPVLDLSFTSALPYYYLFLPAAPGSPHRPAAEQQAGPPSAAMIRHLPRKCRIQAPIPRSTNRTIMGIERTGDAVSRRSA